MKRIVGIMVWGAMLLLVGCGGDGYTPELRAIDTIINEKPDSALRLLDSLSTEAGNSVAKTCNQVSSNYKRGCVNTIGTPPLTISPLLSWRITGRIGWS